MPYLKGFGLENFRVFKDYTWFDFAPITILVGPNSSGKSSLIKALQLMKDNYKRGNLPVEKFDLDSFEIFQEYNLSVDNKHTYLHNADSILSTKKDKSLTFSIRYNPFNDIFEKDFLLTFSYELYKNNLTPSLIAKIEIFDTKELIIEHNYSKNIFRFSINNLKKYLTYSYINRKSKNESIDDVLEKINKDNENSFFKSEGISNIDELNARIFIQNYLIHLDYDDSLFTCNPIIENSHITGEAISRDNKFTIIMPNNYYSIIQCIEKGLNTVGEENSKVIAEGINNLFGLNKDNYPFGYHFKKSIYLSPVRSNPKRYYSLTDKGNIIYKHLAKLDNERIINKEFSKKDNSFLSKWEKVLLQYPIEWRINEDLGIIEVIYGDKYLTDVGFGLQQIINILLGIHSLDPPHKFINRISSTGLTITGLMMLEEPEISLHPALQAKLADLFADCHKTLSLQSIVETHSEYLIRKLQYLVAKGELKPEDVIIYYFHDPDNIPKGEEQVKKINVLEDGSLSDDFGPGFFDEAAHWELELLKLRKGKSRQN